jgi:hypothetical protein
MLGPSTSWIRVRNRGINFWIIRSRSSQMRNGQVSSVTLLAPDSHRAEAKWLSLKIYPAADAMAGIDEGDPMAEGETKRLNKGCTYHRSHHRRGGGCLWHRHPDRRRLA